jgi:predicted MFS family arabinose efflux permease
MTRDAPPGRWAVVAAFLLAYWLSFFYRSTNAVIADDLARDVGLGAGSLGLMTSVFFLTFASVQLPLGAALDRFGARFVTPALLLAAVAGSLWFAVATDLVGLAVGRALIGLGMAGVLMGALKAFAAWFDPRSFARISSLFVGIGSLGALAAATPLAWLASSVGWRAVFTWGALLVLLAAATIMIVVREPRAIRGSAAVGRGGFGLVFRDGAFWRLALLTLAVTGGLFAWQGLWMGPLLTQRLGLDPLAAGNVLLALGSGVTVGFLGSGLLAARLGLARTVTVGAGAFLLTTLAWLLTTPDWPVALLAALAAAMGVAGASNVLSYALAREAFPEMPGRAVTAVNLFGIGGGALLQWGLGLVVGAFPSAAERHPPVAFEAALVVTALIVLVALVRYAPLTLRGARPRP